MGKFFLIIGILHIAKGIFDMVGPIKHELSEKDILVVSGLISQNSVLWKFAYATIRGAVVAVMGYGLLHGYRWGWWLAIIDRCVSFVMFSLSIRLLSFPIPLIIVGYALIILTLSWLFYRRSVFWPSGISQPVTSEITLQSDEKTESQP